MFKPSVPLRALSALLSPLSFPPNPAVGLSHRYDQIVLDTLERLPHAVKLYQRMGYEVVPRYNDNPLPDILYYGRSKPPSTTAGV